MNVTRMNTADYQKLVRSANQVYNQAFYGTLLSEFRRSNPSSAMGGGVAASCINQMFDAHLIESLNGRSNSPLAKMLTKKYHMKGAGSAAHVVNPAAQKV
jgi:hypothetical protein